MLHRPHFPALHRGQLLTHAQLQHIARINATLDAAERAHRRMLDDLRRGAPIDPQIIEPRKVA